MATKLQIAANRRNAQRSTGPATTEGKAAIRFNAVQHGIDAQSILVPGESAEDFQTLIAQQYERWRPANPEERDLVDLLISCQWLNRRYLKAAAKLFPRSVERYYGPCMIASGDHVICNQYNRVHSHLHASRRDYYRTLKELQRLQQDRPKLAPPADAYAAAAPQAPETTLETPAQAIEATPQTPKLALFLKNPKTTPRDQRFDPKSPGLLPASAQLRHDKGRQIIRPLPSARFRKSN